MLSSLAVYARNGLVWSVIQSLGYKFVVIGSFDFNSSKGEMNTSHGKIQIFIQFQDVR